MCKANDQAITHIISSVLNFLKNNTNCDMTEWGRLCFGIFVERKALMFLRNGTNTNLYLAQKLSLLKFSGTLSVKKTI